MQLIWNDQSVPQHSAPPICMLNVLQMGSELDRPPVPFER